MNSGGNYTNCMFIEDEFSLNVLDNINTCTGPQHRARLAKSCQVPVIAINDCSNGQWLPAVGNYVCQRLTLQPSWLTVKFRILKLQLIKQYYPRR